MLNEKEKETKEYMLTKFVPALNSIFKEKNPTEYEKWGKNACRQTAIYGAYYLEKALPDYTWTVWDGNFEDKLYGNDVVYNHAWNFGVDRKNKRKLFVDMARIHTEPIFELTDRNRYPKTDEYKDLVEINRVQLDWKQMLEEDSEYYTSYNKDEMLQEIEKRL